MPFYHPLSVPLCPPLQLPAANFLPSFYKSIFFFFQIPHKSEMIEYLSFCLTYFTWCITP